MKGSPANGKRRMVTNAMPDLPRTYGHELRPSHKRTYSSWWAMICRCYQTKNAEFVRYGEAGRAICERWLNFHNFLADMGERPEGKTLDRFPDGDGDYSPDNCRWATPHEQGVNRSTTILTIDLVQEIHGRHEHGESNASISRRVGVSRCHISLILSGAKWKGSKDGYSEEDLRALSA